MPQMSPMWWTTLMLVFIISYMILLYIMYFNYNKNIYKINNKKIKTNWTW